MGKREKKSTKVESFDFSTDERSEVMKKRDMKGREKAREERIRVLKKGKRQEFVPLPVSMKIFTPTVAKAPKLSTLNRSALKERYTANDQQTSFKAAPMPAFKAPRMREMKKRPLTKPINFKFRTDMRLLKKEATKGKKEKENSFSATEMPDFNRSQIVIKSSKKTPTKPKAPQLNTENRAALKQA